MNEFFGKKIDVVSAQNINSVNLKYKINWGRVLRLAPFIFVGLCVAINVVLIAKKLVWCV